MSIRDRFVADAGQWYKMWSSWLAVLWGVVVTVLWNDPSLLPSIIEALPPQLRAMLSPLVIACAGALPIVVRLLKQARYSHDG